MTKAQEALKTIKEIELTHMGYESDENYDGEWEYEAVEVYDGTVEDNYPEEIRFLETALEEKEKNDFELEVFKLAYEWKCNGVNGTYEEVLDKARKTVEGWKEIERRGYGTIITD